MFPTNPLPHDILLEPTPTPTIYSATLADGTLLTLSIDCCSMVEDTLVAKLEVKAGNAPAGFNSVVTTIMLHASPHYLSASPEFETLLHDPALRVHPADDIYLTRMAGPYVLSREDGAAIQGFRDLVFVRPSNTPRATQFRAGSFSVRVIRVGGTTGDLELRNDGKACLPGGGQRVVRQSGIWP